MISKFLTFLFNETFSSQRVSSRIPEPDLVMNDPEQIKSYFEGSLVSGMGQYIYTCANLCEILKPGDRVLDLGCGPCIFLSMIANMFPDVKFCGLDLADNMLQMADDLIKEKELKNIALVNGDMCKLSEIFGEESFDVVISTVTLHHLPTAQHLLDTFDQISKVLKPDGRVFLLDFIHLNSDSSIPFISQKNVESQNAIFTLDYENSLKAAFWNSDFKEGAKRLEKFSVSHYSMSMFPILMCIRSDSVTEFDEKKKHKIEELISQTKSESWFDYQSLKYFFRFGGLTCKYC